MKRGMNMKRKLLILLLSLGLLISLFALPSSAEEVEPSLALTYYGREALGECENSAALLYAYDAISAGVEATLTEINLSNGTDTLSAEELATVMDAYRRDRADHFWLGNAYEVASVEGKVVSMKPSYLFVGDELTAARAEVEFATSEIIFSVKSEWSDFEKLVYLHDTLAARIEYAEGENAHNLFGAIVNGKSVCEGYAEALQYLLHMLNIRAFLAIGTSTDPIANTPVGHEWSYVQIDGKWCHVDLTWDDQGEQLYHAYLGLTDTEIARDHELSLTAYALPTCDSDANNYFVKNGTAMNAPYDVDAIASVLVSGRKSGSFYVSDTESFVEFVDSNIYEIAQKCGITGEFTRSFALMGNEVKLSLTITDCTHSTTTPVDEQPAKCGVAGVKAHLVCEDCGKTLDFETKAPVLNSELEIAALSHSYTKKNETEEYVREKGTCKQKVTYWYACEHCEKSAGFDPNATEAFYEGEAAGDHTFSEKWTSVDGEHWRACTQNGCNAKTDRASHTFGTDFLYKTADGHAHLCTVCGDHDEIIPHKTEEGTEPTETEPVRCTDCGYKVIPPLNHKTHTPAEEWITSDVAHWHECTGCEGQQLDYRIHIDKDKDGLCDTCAYAVPLDPETKPIEDKLLELTSSLTKQQITYIAIGAAAIIILAVIIEIATIARKRRKW